MTGRTKHTSLITESVVRTFDRTQVDEFTSYVAELDRDTIMTAIGSYEDLAMGDTGYRKCDKYRYTHLSLRQLCSHTSAGLMQLISDIGGVTRRNDTYDEVISVPTAVRIFNACVKLRLMRRDGLYGKQLISNTQHKTIDGVVGSVYKYLPHYYLYDAVTEMFSDRIKPPVFHYAQLTGRRLSMSLLHPCTFTVGEHEYSSGFYFANSEAGECSVTAAFVVGRTDTSHKCIGRLHRIAHSGKKFSSRLLSIIDSAVRDIMDHVTLTARFAKLASTELDLSSGSTRLILERWLARCDIEAPVVELIVDWTAHSGSDEKTMPMRRSHEAVTRTSMDLFIRLITEASEYAPKIRERLEHAAFKLLMGDLAS